MNPLAVYGRPYGELLQSERDELLEYGRMRAWEEDGTDTFYAECQRYIPAIASVLGVKVNR